MKHRFGFFDVDCLELNDAGDGLALRPRVEPLADRLASLRGFAERRGVPLVFTTCCSGRMLPPDGLPDVLFVPLDAADVKWRQRLAGYRLFYIQKNAYGDGKVNFACRAYDAFGDSGNAALLVRALMVDEWIVFGNGFDLCVHAAARGLVAAGQKVCLLSDLHVRSARGYYVDMPRGRVECGTPENLARIIADMEGLGVRMTTLDQFLSAARQ